MHDQHGMLLVKAQRSKNELYKVRMGIKKAVQLNLAYIFFLLNCKLVNQIDGIRGSDMSITIQRK